MRECGVGKKVESEKRKKLIDFCTLLSGAKLVPHIEGGM
jgi:hypothetical protein